MRERDQYLSEREIFILENHPAMSYRAIGEVLGIGPERVRQIKIAALRKEREAKKKEQAAERNRCTITLKVTRKDLHIILRGLEEHEYNLVRFHADLRRKNTPENEDPDYQRTTELIRAVRGFLLSEEDGSELEIYPRLETVLSSGCEE